MKIYEFTLSMPVKPLEKWYQWFEGRGVPVALVQDTSKVASFSVWRGTEFRMRSDPWYNSFKIIKSANGFKKGGK